MMDTYLTEPPIDSVQEAVDPLAISGMSLSSNEDGLPRRNNRKQSMLFRLRKLKQPETNGQVNGITPHPPPDKSVRNSIGNNIQSAVIPSEAHHLQNRVESPMKEKHISLDPFTAVTDIDCETCIEDVNKDTFHGESQGYISWKISGMTSDQYDRSAKNQTSALQMRRLNTPKQNKTSLPIINVEAETEKCMQGDKSANVKSHESDCVNNACVTPVNVESMEATVHLSGGHHLMIPSTDTKVNHGVSSLLQLLRQKRLSPLIEQSSQELKDDQVEKTVIKKVTEVEKSSVLNTDSVTGKEHVDVIQDESDSDDLVVMPDNTRKAFPVFVEEHSNPKMNRIAETPAVLNEKSVVTSTPTADNGGYQELADLYLDVPALNLKGIISDEESLDEDSGGVSEGNRTTDPNQQNDVDVVARRAEFNREDKGVACGSDLSSIESDSIEEKKDSVARHADVLETESKMTVCRENRTSNNPGIGISLSKSAGVLDSSDMVQRGKLSPVTPKKYPPQLEENFSSLLRTSNKKDNMSRSMVLSEPLLRSTEELSDTNRSFLSTGALPPISTKKARTRSFLSGGMRNTGSLLGREELERFFPDRKLTIFVATWNMCELKILPENLEDFLLPEHAEFDNVQDMYVIGTQESSPDGSEWQISLQETLGPSHALLHTATHGVLRLLIFLRRDLIWFCSPVEEDQVSTRPGSMIKTKGAVAASFTFFGTSFLFINSHFTSGDENMKDRLLDYDKICKGLQLPVKVEPTKRFDVLKADVTTRFDCIFWFGDFNFRLVGSRKKMENWANQLRDGTKTDYSILLCNDQLLKAMNKKEIFKGFQEGPIEFVPSYKYDIGNDTYDTSEKQRVPSYTDRVLFKSRKKNDITVLRYMTCDQIKVSDHRPVYGVYQVNIRPGKENMLLGGGQFHRDVFIEANKRRSEQAGMAVTLRSQQTSLVCVVM